ncbi:MAG: lipoyl synthase [Pseudomonadota bacterium]|nr:lipoyl synthase [Pseudomonadota bacterium]MEC8978145.1 lipoyl synthase [Pseudomonadota bacterium]
MNTPTILHDKKERAKEKLARIPIKIPVVSETITKPDWIKVRINHNPRVGELKKLLREHRLVTVCEEATCPNLHECFGKGTATFMIMGDRCTRRCSFCDVAHGRPDPLDPDEPDNLAKAIAKLKLSYVVVTSVDRDDLRDGGAEHFQRCIAAIRKYDPRVKIEVLVPDFRGRMDKALAIMAPSPPDVFNHNIETVPELYKQARPGSCYQHSLNLLKLFKQQHPGVITKSGLMVGLGEQDHQIQQTLIDLKKHDVDMITIGQYLAPSQYHLPVARYMHPDRFKFFETFGYSLGFKHVASGPMVRSSYHADHQSEGVVS